MRRSPRIALFVIGIVAGSLVLVGSAVFHGPSFGWLWEAPAARAAATLVQTATGNTTGNGGTSVNASFGTTPVSGNLLIAVVGADGSESFAPPSGWSVALSQATSVSQAIYYKTAGAAEPTTVTVTASTSLPLGIHIYEYSGLSPTFPVDATSSATGNSSSTNGASITTTQPDELIFAATTINGQTSFSSWSNSFTKENDFANNTGNANSRATYSAADRVVTATGTYSSVGVTAAAGAWIGQIVGFRARIIFTQAAYRFFTNTNSTSVGSPIAGQSSPMTQTSPGTPFRLRMLINVSSSQLAMLSRSFKLQYVNEGTGTCASPSAGSYTDVVTSTGPLRYYDNSIPNDGDALSPTSTDPVDGTNTIVNQTYEEANPFTNSLSAIPVGEDGKWDFSLVDNNASSSATYCFRAVENNGAAFTNYSVYPQFSIGNFPPSISSMTFNGGNDITLVVGSSQTVQATATVSDPNGYTDIATVTAMFYRTSLGYTCTPNDNNCYQIPTCSLSGCFGTSCTATCSANIWYFAEPTDAGTPWTGDSWTAWMKVTDHSNATTTATSSPVSLLSLLGFSVTNSINYGSFSPGQSFSTLTASTVILEAGNVSANATLYGTNMANGANTIAVGNQHYATSSLTYASGTPLLVNPGTTTYLNIPKTTVNGFPASSTVYWGIAVPNPEPSGNFSGVNTFIAVKNSLPWP